MKIEILPLFSALSLIAASNTLQAEIKNFDISGVIEAEVGFVDSDTNGDSSDISVPTVEFGVETTFSEQVSASIVLLAEDIGTAGQTSVEVDEAVINLALGGAMLTIGQTTVPFGAFETGAISDPLTLELAETAETVIMYGREMESGLSYSVFAFNGDTEKANEDEINDIGFNISMNQDSWTAGVAYISNIGDSDTIGGLGDSVADDVAGLNLYGSIKTGPVSVFFEHVTALDDFKTTDFGGAEITAQAQPSATHIEIGFELDDKRAIALSISSTDEAADIELYENATAIAYSTSLYDNVGYAIEFVSADEYGMNSDTILTVQIAMEF